MTCLFPISDAPLDLKVKSNMVSDLLNLVGECIRFLWCQFDLTLMNVNYANQQEWSAKIQ